jgi:hypothetical protein
MTKEELKNFMTKIKAHYQEFSTEDYVVKEWYKKLKPFDIEDVEKKFENHLNSEYQKNIPRLNFIVKGLKTPEEKIKTENIRIRCQHCGQTIELEKLDNHIARHNSIFYIKSKEHYLGQSYNEEKMLNAYQVQFDRFYDNFLAELYCKIEEKDEKERLEKIIFAK